MGLCWSDESQWIQNALADTENVVDEKDVADRLRGDDEMEEFLNDEYEKLEIYQRFIRRWSWLKKVEDCRYPGMNFLRKTAVRTDKMFKLNMSYVNDIYGTQRYILTQAPLRHEENLFVETIYQEKIQLIIILGNASDLDVGKLGDYFVRKRFNSNESHLRRVRVVAKTESFNLNKHLVVIPEENQFLPMKDERYVYVLYYKEWPDFDTADIKHVRTIVELIWYVFEERLVDSDSKVMIHCSAGLGRSGALMGSLTCLQWLEELDFPINIPAIANYVRRQRLGAIQTYPQYRLLYSVVNDWYERDRGRTFCMGVDWNDEEI